MDVYLNDVRVQLKLAEASLTKRLSYLQDRPVGMIMRHTHIKHTMALLALVQELKTIAAIRPDEWQDEKDDIPF